MGLDPILKPKELAGILKKLGFVQVRQKRAHRPFRHPDGRCTMIPSYQGEDISPNLLRQIAKDIKLTVPDIVGYR